jgi:hypothetical protein
VEIRRRSADIEILFVQIRRRSAEISNRYVAIRKRSIERAKSSSMKAVSGSASLTACYKNEVALANRFPRADLYLRPAWLLSRTFTMNTTRTTESNVPSETAGPAAPLPQPAADSPTAAVAAQLIGLLEQFESLVPGFQPHDAAEVHRVATAARFANELIQPTITAVSSFAPASERKMFDIERGTAALQYRDALRPVAQRLSALLDGVEFTIDSQLAEAGAEALQTYAWAKAYAKGRTGAGLRPYLDEMRRVVRKAINRRKPPASAPPSPQPSLGFLPSNLASAQSQSGGEDDLPDSFRKALNAVS